MNGWDRYAYVYVLDDPTPPKPMRRAPAGAGLIHEAQPA